MGVTGTWSLIKDYSGSKTCTFSLTNSIVTVPKRPRYANHFSVAYIMCVNSFSYIPVLDMKHTMFLFQCKDNLVSVILFHMQLDEYDMSLSYKFTLIKIGDLRYANHTKKLINRLLQLIKIMLLSY